MISNLTEVNKGQCVFGFVAADNYHKDYELRSYANDAAVLLETSLNFPVSKRGNSSSIFYGAFNDSDFGYGLRARRNRRTGKINFEAFFEAIPDEMIINTTDHRGRTEIRLAVNIPGAFFIYYEGRKTIRIASEGHKTLPEAFYWLINFGSLYCPLIKSCAINSLEGNMGIASNNKKIISFDTACSLLRDFIHETDADSLASLFSTTFGYDVEIDIERETFICTPNGLCGNILDNHESLKG